MSEPNLMASPAVGSIKVVVLCGTYILVSTVLIRFNKFLMSPTQFPHAMQLTTIHMAVSLLLCTLLYLTVPSAFPRMAATAGHRANLFRWFGPISACFAIALYLSNKAYEYSNVAFLQFMKENNVLIAFLMSCVVGLQQLDRVKLAVIIWVIIGSSMAIGGELHFLWIGFFMQLGSQLAECSRAVMGEFVLTGVGLRLDPLTYTMFSAPLCLAVLLVGSFYTWDPKIPGRLGETWHLLVPNALLAFVLNVLVAAIIKETAAVGFVLTGIVKDIFIVVVSALYFGEVVTERQVLGFFISLLGIFFWSYLKANPNPHWLRSFQADERTSLVAKSLITSKATTASGKRSSSTSLGV